jgi:hypothetical protein
MIPTPRDPDQKYLHISVFPLHRDLLYVIPTVALIFKPTNGDLFHVSVYLWSWVVRLEII